jgi:putative ABC transport system permease protein
METGPIFRSLMRNKIGATLIALQIAFTMTASLNAWVMINERLERADRPSGMNETDTFHLQSYGFANNASVSFNNPEYSGSVVTNDLRLIREMPGVVNAVQMNAIPLSGGGWSTGIRADQDEDAQSFGVAVYLVDEHAIDSLGVELLAGDNFVATDITWRNAYSNDWPPKVIVSRAMAESLYPDIDPYSVVGKTVIMSESPTTIIGIVEGLQSPWTDSDSVERTVLIPQRQANKSTRYMIRTEPGLRDKLMPQVEEMLANSNSGRIIRNMYSMEETRNQSYSLDVGLAKILSFVMVVLLLITGLGILGLASFSVRRRIKQIGIRRALGATQGDIRRYFLIENLLITGVGVTVGAVMSVGFNIWLVDLMNFPKIEWYGIPLGIVVLIALGQLAVLGPAQQACGVSPATATRTV